MLQFSTKLTQMTEPKQWVHAGALCLLICILSMSFVIYQDPRAVIQRKVSDPDLQEKQ